MRVAVGLALSLVALPALASEVTVVLCDDPSEVEAAALLDRWVPTARVEVAERCPAPAPGRYVGRFEPVGAAVVFQLRAPDGFALERAVPWLDGARKPLRQLVDGGRLSEFSVLVESLLTEHRLMESFANPAPPAVADPPQPQELSQLGFRPRRKGQATSASRSRDAGKKSGATLQKKTVPAGAGPEKAPPAKAAPVAAVDPPTAEPPSAPAEEPVAAPAPARPAAGPEVALATERPPERFSRAPYGQVAVDFVTPSDERLPLRLSGGAALRLRGPGIAAAEYALAAEVGPIWLRGALQPRVTWELLGYPLGVEAMGFEGGLLASFYSDRIWSLAGGIGLAVERLEILPLYLDGGGSTVTWDLGPIAAARLGYAPLRGLGLAATAGVQWMPTARLAHLGNSGPAARINAVGARFGIEVAWPE